MANNKKYSVDIDGSELMSSVLLDLLNTFPGLSDKKVAFSTLEKTTGIGFFPTGGAAILKEIEDVTGHISQTCLYPFTIVYRASPSSEQQRIRIKELLDTMGKWFERAPVIVNDKTHQLKNYPVINNDNRVIKSITRTQPAHLAHKYEDDVEDWELSGNLHYTNEYDT